MQDVIQNSFEKGRNVDVDEALQGKNQYRKAINCTVTAEGGFFTIQNIKGSSYLVDLVSGGQMSSTPNVLGAFEVNSLYKAGVYSGQTEDEINPSIALFVYSELGLEKSSKILMYDITRNVVHTLFGTGTNDNALGFTATGTIDAVVFGENGYSNIYFADRKSPIRKLPCIVDDPYTLSIRDISLRSYAPVDPITYASQSQTGGNLQSGTYQFAYRYVRSSTNKATTWSLLTNPMPVYPPNFNTSVIKEDIYGGVPGEPTTKAIVLNIGKTSDNSSYYDSVQLAVIKNINGDKNVSQVAFITPAKTSWFNTPGSITYTGTDKETEVDIAEIVLEDAAIKSVGTISTKDNVLIGGDIGYSDLSDVNPTFTTASTIKAYLGNLGTIDSSQNVQFDSGLTAKGVYKNPINCANKRGYFRSETYAFGVTYMDEYGNWSEPKRLDFSAQQGIAGKSYGSAGCIDWKFPQRKDNGYALLDATNDVAAIGLGITGLTNHPSWAKAVAIVRGKRIKNIIWQSPLVPMIQAMPTLNYEGVGPGSELSESEETRLGTDGSWIPKKYATGLMWHILRNSLTDNNTRDNAEYVVGIRTPVHLMLPPEFLYSFNGTSFDPLRVYQGASIKPVDAVSYGAYSRTKGDWDYTAPYNKSYGFVHRADNYQNYYYMNGYTKTGLFFETNTGVVTYKQRLLDIYPLALNGGYYTMPLKRGFDLEPGLEINRVYFGDSISLVNFGAPFNTQKGLAALSENHIFEIMYLSARSDVPTYNSIIAFNFGPDSSSVYNPGVGSYDSEGGPNKLAIVSGASNTPSVGSVSADYIVNYELGLDEFRYGDKNAQMEYIFTGAYAPITSSDQLVNLEVWGGDCFISKHYAKTANTNVGIFPGASVPDSRGDENNNQVKAYPEFAEVLGMFVESEVNCDLSSQNLSYPVVTSTETSAISTEWRYDYNFGYSVQNEAKVFVSADPSLPKKNTFKARLIISDQKIYQSNIEGFDRFRAGSFYDMDESFGGITKLDISPAGDMICFQERGISNLNIGKNIVEDANGTQLALKSDTVITKPQYITTTNGCQHIRSIVKTSLGFMFADVRKRSVMMLSDGVEPVSGNGMYSYFQEKLNGSLPTYSLQSVYDFNNNDYIIYATENPFAHLYSDKVQGWTSELQIETSNLLKLVFANKNLYNIGINNLGNLVIEQMYAGDYGKILGVIQKSELQVIANNEDSLPKIFDNIAIDATSQLKTLTVSVRNEDEEISTSAPVDMKFSPRQNMYEIQILRDQQYPMRRMRGKYAIIGMEIDNTTNKKVGIKKIYTKFRNSERKL